MLKRWKFPPLIKACASSTNCTMGNLATQHAYIQSMLNPPRFISFLLYKSLVSAIKKYIYSNHIFISKKIVENLKSCFFFINSQPWWLFVYLSILHRFNIETQYISSHLLRRCFLFFEHAHKNIGLHAYQIVPIQFWMHIFRSECIFSVSVWLQDIL